MEQANLLTLETRRTLHATERVGCLHELFETQVDLRPDAPALVSDQGELSYLELERQANRVAHYLRGQGLGPGHLVGLFTERGLLPIVGILGSLKAGVAYVPIDPVHPDDRIRHILDESGLRLVLTDKTLAPRAERLFAGPRLVLGDAAAALSHQPTDRLSRAATGLAPHDLCYVIYTSGTTGKPKGVMAEHRHAVGYVRAFNAVCGTSPADRVYQGFALGFDGSVEEIWMAYSNGSALVVGGKGTAKFGDDVATYLTAMGVTYFSTVPTALSTIGHDVPTLKTLVVSGEMCPPELVGRWARPGRRMLNVYGPTEATVNTTAVECLPGRKITIGRPLPGYETHVVGEDLAPLPPGETGELLVAGPTLARGYLNRPDLTAERFISWSRIGEGEPRRAYRTGDLARVNADGDLEIFGRIDGQVKVRGFRVELAEIEALLLGMPGIRAASVAAIANGGQTELAAYVLLKEPGETLDRSAVLQQLRAKLPPYMVPAYLDVLAELPTLTSGKVDRRRLPAPALPLVDTSRRREAPATPRELALVDIWAKLFRLPVGELSVTDDFFTDLGGHSLLAAQMVTTLRIDHGEPVTIRDAYANPTLRGLATFLDQAAKPAAARPAAARAPAVSAAARTATTVWQAAALYVVYALYALPLAALVPLAMRAYTGAWSWWQLIGAAIGIDFALWPTLMALSVAAKWVLIGRFEAGSYPLYGWFYARWWLVRKLAALSGAGLFTGTPLLNWYLRAMGARIGRRCVLDTALFGAYDLISIGDDTSIGADTQLLGFRVEDGQLRLGGVAIGARCFAGIHSCFGLGVRMEDDGRLDDQSLLPDGAVLPQGAGWRGSPAAPAALDLPPPAPAPGAIQAAALGVLHVVLAVLLPLVPLAGALPFLAALIYATINYGFAGLAVGTLVAVPAAAVYYPFYAAALKRLVTPRPVPGDYPVASLAYLRKWFADSLMIQSKVLLLPLYTTLYLPPWLRLLGAKIGARAELSTVLTAAPELLDLGEESFFADGSILASRRVFRGTLRVARTVVGRRTFIGNSAIVPVGVSFGERCLLGVSSAPPFAAQARSGAGGAGGPHVPDGTEWVGSPAFALPNRQKVGNFSVAETFKPTARLYAIRAVIDACRVLIPGLIALPVGVLGAAALWEAYLHAGALAMALLAPLALAAMAVLAMLAVIGLKRAVMGRFEPVIKPLWCVYVWLNEMVNGAYESVMAPALVPLLGTPFAAPFLRAIGVTIGKRVYLDSTLFSEWDLVAVGDGAALNPGAIIQTHLFEDRVMKSSWLKIGPNCSVGNMAVILYDTEMHAGATLGPLSLLMKGERQGEGTRWHGIPTVSEQA